MIQIRRYQKSDFKACLALLHDFCSEDRGIDYANHYKTIDIDKKSFYETLTNNLENINFFFDLIIQDNDVVGGLCAYVAKPFYSLEPIAYDQILYVKPSFKNYRVIKQLLNNYIQWATNRKVSECRLSSSTGYRQKAFSKLCERNGFEKIIVGFTRKLS